MKKTDQNCKPRPDFNNSPIQGMRRAGKSDKVLIVDMLTKSFDTNASVNYIIRQGKKRIKRIRALMDYSFEVCHLFGDVFINTEGNACALIVYPDAKRTTLKSILLDAKLIFRCVGLGNLMKTIKREKIISSAQPKIPMTYLWFIGVFPSDQNNGIGSKLLQSIIDYSSYHDRPIYLETSTVKNLPWYEQFGFEVYHEVDLSYHLYFFKRDIKR
ncbi:GNAT family N-acetyltransferase [Parafilimonas sp.]|uniref:GNAT family N-acetyltransferase n=1 Tax=Parafilimonas sp. TaxID=1969739 RepID=UPI003F7F4496